MWTFVGTVALPAGEHPDWPSLWRARTATLLDLMGAGTELRRELDALGERLDVVGGPPRAPARIHRDLWSGNVVWSSEERLLGSWPGTVPGNGVPWSRADDHSE